MFYSLIHKITMDFQHNNLWWCDVSWMSQLCQLWLVLIPQIFVVNGEIIAIPNSLWTVRWFTDLHINNGDVPYLTVSWLDGFTNDAGWGPRKRARVQLPYLLFPVKLGWFIAGWGPKIAFSWDISGWILWFMVDITN